MDQQKIGEFIAKLRKAKGLTQQELAKKIGVTNKAISKWENGHGLMDITMLKPLSEQLDVTVIELMNGERIAKEEINSKTDEFVNNTIKLANKKVVERVKSGIRVIGMVILIIVLFVGYLFCKGIAAEYIFNYELMSCDEVMARDTVYGGLSFDKKMVIKKQKIAEDDYIVISNLELDNNNYSLKVRNDFKDMHCDVNATGACNSFHKLTSDGKAFREITRFYVDKTAIDYFKMDSSKEFGDTQAYREKYLKKNDINNDIDLLKYIRNNYYLNEDVNLLFDSFKDIRDNYMIVSFTNDYMLRIKSSTIIIGDYQGYMLTTSYNYDIGFEEDKVTSKIVYILENDVVYAISFIGNKYTDEYIENFLSTLVIE